MLKKLLLAPFKLVPVAGPAVQAAARLDQRTPGGQKNWIGTDGVRQLAVKAATKGEARAKIRDVLGIPKKGRLPVGWKITLAK